MKTLKRGGWVWLAVVATGLLLAMGQAKASTGDRKSATSVAQEDEASLKGEWQRRYGELLDRIADAEARLAEGRKTIRKLRQRDRYQGTERQEVDTEVATATQELEAAKREVATFPDDARQAGVPPGWLREVEERRAREG